MKSSLVGEAAHIYGKAAGAARYDVSMTDAQRGSIDNAIWLCRTCHKSVDDDKDGVFYSAETLSSWKTEHEAWLRKQFEGSRMLPHVVIRRVEHVTPPTHSPKVYTSADMPTEPTFRIDIRNPTNLEYRRFKFFFAWPWAIKIPLVTNAPPGSSLTANIDVEDMQVSVKGDGRHGIDMGNLRHGYFVTGELANLAPDQEASIEFACTPMARGGENRQWLEANNEGKEIRYFLGGDLNVVTPLGAYQPKVACAFLVNPDILSISAKAAEAVTWGDERWSIVRAMPPTAFRGPGIVVRDFDDPPDQ